MILSSLDLPAGTAPRVLALGAHCDDVEIGCGGALQVLAARYPELDVRWTILSSNEQRAAESHRAAKLLLPTTDVRLDIGAFRESYFPYIGAEIKDYVEARKREFSPDLIFTHFRGDRHQDHQLVAELTHNAYRDHLILEYEVPKYDGDLASPNVHVPISREQMDHKIRVLREAYASQRGRSWFTADTFSALLRLRGIEANSPSGLAEAFHCSKLRLMS